MHGWGSRLKRCRLDLGLTQQKMAERLGVRVQTYIDWEKHDVEPSASKVAKLADAFGVSMDWLWRGRESRRAA